MMQPNCGGSCWLPAQDPRRQGTAKAGPTGVDRLPPGAPGLGLATALAGWTWPPGGLDGPGHGPCLGGWARGVGLRLSGWPAPGGGPWRARPHLPRGCGLGKIQNKYKIQNNTYNTKYTASVLYNTDLCILWISWTANGSRYVSRLAVRMGREVLARP